MDLDSPSGQCRSLDGNPEKCRKVCACSFAQKWALCSPTWGPYLALLGALGLGLSLEDPDSGQRWNCPRDGPAQPGEDKVALEGPPGPPAWDPPLLSSAGPQSLPIYPRTETARAWVQGDMGEGEPQRERGPEWVRALSKNLMNK